MEHPEQELPAWALTLTPQDSLWMLARIAREPAEKKDKILEEWREIAQMPAYQAHRAVLNGEPLEHKDILLPVIPTEDPRPSAGWMKGDPPEWKTYGELYTFLQKHAAEEWQEICRDFEDNPNDFHNAWLYLDHHPAFWEFRKDDGKTPAQERVHEKHVSRDFGVKRCIDISVVKVNPITGRAEGDDGELTRTQVWIETGKISWPGRAAYGNEPKNKGETYYRDAYFHDTDLDCGADTLEEAIICAAVYVHTAYGNDRQICDREGAE